MAEIFAEPKNWVLVGLILFLGIVVYAGAHRVVLKALDDRAAGIAAELEQAAALRKEAEQLLRAYESKRESAEAEGRAIVATARADAEALRREAERQLAADLSRRERQVEERISRAEDQATAEIRTVAAEAAIAAAERILRGDAGADAHKQSLASGVKELATRFR